MGRHRTPDEKAAFRDRALALRRSGVPRQTITAELGISDKLLTQLLADEPVHPRNRRPRAKDDLRQLAVEMRLAGRTYDDIALELGTSKGTLSLWLRDLPHPEWSAAGMARRTAAVRAAVARSRDQRDAQRTRFVEEVATGLGAVSGRELVIAVAVAYWCEGTKRKPWKRSEVVQFMNSDLQLIRLFLAGLRVLDVVDERIGFRLSIHESADVEAALRWWQNELQVDAARFASTNLKRHNPSTVRKNTGDSYHGCLTVRVLRGASLYRIFEGLLAGLVEGAAPGNLPSGGWGSELAWVRLEAGGDSLSEPIPGRPEAGQQTLNL